MRLLPAKQQKNRGFCAHNFRGTCLDNNGPDQVNALDGQTEFSRQTQDWTQFSISDAWCLNTVKLMDRVSQIWNF